MKPAPFEYHAPATVDEVVELLHELGDEAKVLAGGQSLIPMLNLRLARFEALIDIGRVASLRPDRAGQRSRRRRGDGPPERCGGERRDRPRRAVAGRRHPADRPFPDPQPGHARWLDRPRRSGRRVSRRGARPRRRDRRRRAHGRAAVPAAAFFDGTWETTMASDELLVGRALPGLGPQSGFAVEEVARRHGDFAIAGCACGVQLGRRADRPGGHRPVRCGARPRCGPRRRSRPWSGPMPRHRRGGYRQPRGRGARSA